MLNPSLKTVRDRASFEADSQRVSDAEIRDLAKSASLAELGVLAEKVRYAWNPKRTVTYLVDRNINYTNVCNTDCTFCAFYRPSSKHSEAYVLNREIIAKKLDELSSIGGSRVLLQGGHNDDLPYDYYIELIRWISEKYPQIQINAFSPSEIQQMERVSGKRAEEILIELQQAGLHGLPGGGAEILDDAIRSRVSPKKITAARWLEIMEIAQELDLITSATMVIGFGESFENRLNHFRSLRELQNRAINKSLQGFNLFVSWTLQSNENTSLGRSRHRESYGVSSLEYLRNLALARIYLDNIPHHQSSWPTLGAEIAQLGLQFGCDDIGSTMMEENVVSQAGAPTHTKWFVSPEELQGYIRSAGFIPVERDSSFKHLRTFV